MFSKRFAFVVGILCTSIILMVLAEGCGDAEQTFGPTEPIQQPVLDLNVNVSETKIIGEGIILVAVPKTGEAKEVYDPWIADAILSMLPDATRARLAVKELVYVDDMELAGAIVAMAGIETFDVSDGILLASWGCIKCGYADPPCCSPWPACCDNDKDHGFVPFVDY